MMLDGLALVLSLKGLLFLVAGGLIGFVIGILPGLGPVFGVSLMLPFTFWLPPAYVFIFLGSLYSCCVYGGSVTACLLGIPGTTGSITTCFDGYPLSRQGKAGIALGLSATSSLIGGLFGVVCLATLTPLLARFALQIGPAEYFMLAMFGLSMVAVTARGDALRGLLLGCIGILVSTIGISVVAGENRATFGSSFLEGGIPFVPASIGLFALSQAFVLAEQGGVIASLRKVTSGVWTGVWETLKRPLAVLRHAIMGAGIGIIPGVGINVANFMSYLVESRTHKNADPPFGQGQYLGVIAPEAANNACVSSELIPALAFGIPGGATAAIFLAALTMHDLRPGFDFFQNAGPAAAALIWGFFLAQFLFFFLGVLGANFFSKVTLVRNSILVPTIVALCYVGAYSNRAMTDDVVVMTVFGIAGYFMYKHSYPMACLVLGMILGPMAETNFNRALIISDGSYWIFVSKPISTLLFIIIILLLLYGLLPWERLFKRQEAS
ncbi:MAG: tripartite tricarboxylate transporter permease [Pseudomonadota bacterium]